MKICVVYHSIDLDGWMSAAIVKHWFEQSKTKFNPNKPESSGIQMARETIFNTLDFIGYNYGQPIPDLSEYDKVIMCDVSFPKEEMSKLWHNLDKELIWIDHHISAIKDNNDLVYKGLRDTNYAACELTWQYFFPNETMPEVVRLLGRYDCFGHKTKVFEMTAEGYKKAKQYLTEVSKLQEFENNQTSTDGYSLTHYANTIAEKLSEEQKVLEFQYGARQCISNYEEAYEKLMNNIYYNKTIDKENLKDERVEIWNSGKAIYQYLCTEAKQVYKNGFEIVLSEFIEEGKAWYHKFICINRGRFNPINFGIDYHTDGYNGACCFHYDGKDNLWRFSLYNDNGKVNCSEIAKQYGGGGHAGASGFTLSPDSFNRFMADKI